MSATESSDPTEGILALLEQLRPRLRRILARYRVPPVEAEDILQEATLATLAKWNEIHSKEGWLLITVRNRAAAYRQQQQKNRLQAMDPQFLEDLSKPLPPVQEREALQIDVQPLLRLLGSREQQVLLLRYGLEMTPAEIAARVGYQESSIRKIAGRSLKRVRDKVAARQRFKALLQERL